jgi:APA family basic amino acid/polyamine antiporter
VSKLLSLKDAVFIGLAAMLGAGVFVVFGPALSAAGTYLPLAIVLAGLVAYLNAKSISQLAAKLTRSGGAYAYGRHYIGPAWGFLAGVAFLIGKIGSAAAIALIFANYLTPNYPIFTAVLAIVLMAIVNIFGVTRTAFGSTVLASITLLFLAVLIISSLLAPNSTEPVAQGNIGGALAASALIFFAFAGYARVATLGAEVSKSHKNVPLAINISLSVVLLIYLALGFLALNKLGGSGQGGLTPLRDLAAISLPEPWSDWVFVFAAVACLGSLLALLAGISRTAAVMAEDAELPKIFQTRLNNGAPWLAELTIALLAVVLVFSSGVVFSIGLSSFCVLIYYAIANFAAFRQPKSESERPKLFNLLGLLLCLAIGLAVPLQAILVGATFLLLSLTLRKLISKRLL